MHTLANLPIAKGVFAKVTYLDAYDWCCHSLRNSLPVHPGCHRNPVVVYHHHHCDHRRRRRFHSEQPPHCYQTGRWNVDCQQLSWVEVVGFSDCRQLSEPHMHN